MASAPPPPKSPSSLGGTQEKMNVDQITAIWSKAIETQMHFNEMATKSRQLGLAFATAALGVAVVLLGQGDDFALILPFGLRLHATVLVLIAAVIAVWAVEQLDMVYHHMLRGAVAFGEDFEERHMKPLFRLEKGLTQAITHFSRASGAAATGFPKAYTGSHDKTAGGKVEAFYQRTRAVLWVAVAAIFLTTNLGGTRVENAYDARQGEVNPTAPTAAAVADTNPQVGVVAPPASETTPATPAGTAQTSAPEEFAE